MGALVAAAVLGYVWMGDGGAAAFVLAGLWGTYGAARPWRIGTAPLMVLIGFATVLPAATWLAAMLWPGMAVHHDTLLDWCVERMLGYTLADGRAYPVLAERGLLSQFPALRLGLASCWLAALPAAAAIALWYRDGRRLDPVVLLFGGAATLVLTSALLMSGFGFGWDGFNLAFGAGVVVYPLLFALWLGGVASLRACANCWFPAQDMGGPRAMP